MAVGKAISDAVREVELAFRYGGNEFCVILPRPGLMDAKKVADRITESFKRLVPEELTFSTGIASTGPTGFLSSEELFRQADQLMFEGKELAQSQGGMHVVLPKGDVVKLQKNPE